MKLKSYLNVNTTTSYYLCEESSKVHFHLYTIQETSHSLPWELLGLNAGSMSWWATVLSSGTGARSSAEPHFFMEWNNEVIFLFLRSPAWVRLWHSLTSAWKTNIKAVLRRRPHCAWNNMLEGQIVWRQTVQNWSTRHPVDSEKPHACANVENILSAALSTCATRQTRTCCIAFMHK